LVRVKLWTPAGLILYSDQPRLIGRTFDLDDEARTALTVPQTDASISDLGRPENEFERSQGKLLEVYRPVWTPGGHPLLLETYFRYDTVSERSHGLWFGFAGIILSSLAALLLLLSPIVWSLLRRTRRAQEDRQAMMRRAVESSDAERARIAASLHDGVVQQLVASSLQLAGSARRASAAGDSAHAAELDRAAATVRASVGGLRSLLVEIYPPNLASAGLVPALRDLVSGLRGAEVAISLVADEDTGADLAPAAAEAVYRVAQEALRNAVKHAGASTATVGLQDRPGWLRVTIEDDGTGFDPSAVVAGREDSVRAGHLGLQLITDAAHQAGAELVLTSAPGHGTHYRMDVPTR
jgi:signal transduction histidine kinase